jgi:hypothetical protein
MLTWRGKGDRQVETMIRVVPSCREYRRKKGHVECERPVLKATAYPSQGESRSPTRNNQAAAEMAQMAKHMASGFK